MKATEFLLMNMPRKLFISPGRFLIFAPAYRKYRSDMADEHTYSALAIREQEYEQLQTALENAETEIQALAQENRELQLERSQAQDEIARLRHNLAQAQARLLEAQAAASKSVPRPISGLEGELSIVNEELQISLEELQVTTEELEEANAALLRTNETLEQQVAERTRHLEEALGERDELLRCKDHLLYEIGHRVRDSLQIVMSLIRIQTGRSDNPAVRQALQATGARIHAVAQVHDRLFTGDGSGRVRMDRYLTEICQQIADVLDVPTPQQTIEVEAEPIELPADLAFPLGLVATELVDNALRHAFGKSGTGTVWIQFGRTSDGQLKLVIADDGKGISPSVEFTDTVGLGMHIVALMVQRLRATLSVAHVHGSCFTLKLPKNDEP
jgi:two-component system, sensor histidine kinase PdtaS